MGLNNISIKYSYRSSSDKIFKDFYKPCLETSIFYDRAVGYFSSHSLSLLSEGLDVFLSNGGKVRIIANPHLTKEDIEAIELGYKAKEDVIVSSLLREFRKDTEHKYTSFQTLAWLIYQDQLEIKIAYPNNNGLYHEKFGIFTDNEDNSIAFSGSANETIGGLSNNFEKIDVFFEENDTNRIQDMKRDFENLWNNTTSNVTIMDLPNAIMKEIIQHKTPITNNKEIIPRDYQMEAIEKVKENNWKGILEMATGTGKTITSLLVAKKYYSEKGKIFLVIIAPFSHLVDQWIDNLNTMGYRKIRKCTGSKNSWNSKIQEEIRDYNIGIINEYVVVTTYKTAASDLFNKYMSRVLKNQFLIADECHNFGVQSMRENKMNSFDAKIGLSATPQRWWDDDGTEYINVFFNGTVFEYSLEKAIINKALTEYSYNPIIVNLNDKEIKNYEILTKKLISLLDDKKENQSSITSINIARSRIINKAEDKLLKLVEIFKNKNSEDVSHTLIYCAPGQIDEITYKMKELNYRVHRFNYKVSNEERNKLLKAFEKGKIQILVAIKCLDEGVDVPSTKEAYFMASTSNPREFVQRRGRILRPSENKNIAVIFDFITLSSGVSDSMFTSLAKKELPRFSEFSSHAINQYEARNSVDKLLNQYDLSYLMDKLPWDVYKEHKEGEN